MARSSRLVFLTGGRDFHAFHWYESVTGILDEDRVGVLLDSEIDELGNNYFSSSKYERLFLIDRFLSSNPGSKADKLRNAIKLFFTLLQGFLVFTKTKRDDILWCHGIYYAAIARISKRDYIVTPQGSEVLVRSKNRAYLLFLHFALRKATKITVDSASMAKKLAQYGFTADIVYNGIILPDIYNFKKNRRSVLSPRGLTDLYRISTILEGFSRTEVGYKLEICYPFYQDSYVKIIEDMTAVSANSFILGILTEREYNKLLDQVGVVVSIPSSDSSPKSVYEAIFRGCIIITNHDATWITECTLDMLSRVVLADLSNPDWLAESLQVASLRPEFYVPSDESVSRFSRRVNIEKIVNMINYD
jgi:hypothetical protein